jgi:hypothetical protein
VRQSPTMRSELLQAHPQGRWRSPGAARRSREKTRGSTWVHGVGTGPWALNSSMDGFAQKLHHFSGGRAFTSPFCRRRINVAAKAHLLCCQISVPTDKTESPSAFLHLEGAGLFHCQNCNASSQTVRRSRGRKPGRSRFQDLWPPSSHRPAGARDQFRSSRSAAHQAARRRHLHGEAARGIDQSAGER